MINNNQIENEKQEKSGAIEEKLYEFLQPLLKELNTRLDRRLVCTFLGLVIAIMQHRHRNHGLLLSELGAYVVDP